MGKISAAVDAISDFLVEHLYMIVVLAASGKEAELQFQIGQHLLEVIVKDAGQPLALPVLGFGKFHGKLLNIDGALFGLLGAFDQGRLVLAQLLLDPFALGNVDGIGEANVTIDRYPPHIEIAVLYGHFGAVDGFVPIESIVSPAI